MKWEKISAAPVKTELASGEWRMDLNGKNFFVCNMNIILCPVGLGDTETAAFENMLENIAAYEQKLEQVRTEIREHLNESKGENHD